MVMVALLSLQRENDVFDMKLLFITMSFTFK